MNVEIVGSISEAITFERVVSKAYRTSASGKGPGNEVDPASYAKSKHEGQLGVRTFSLFSR